MPAGVGRGRRPLQRARGKPLLRLRRGELLSFCWCVHPSFSPSFLCVFCLCLPLRTGSIQSMWIHALHTHTNRLDHPPPSFISIPQAVFILVQNLLLLHLLWSLAKPPVSTTHKALAVGLIGGLAAVGWWLPVGGHCRCSHPNACIDTISYSNTHPTHHTTHSQEHKEYLVMLQAPLLIAMKLPQLATNFRNGHTGQVRKSPKRAALLSLCAGDSVYARSGRMSSHSMTHALCLPYTHTHTTPANSSPFSPSLWAWAAH